MTQHTSNNAPLAALAQQLAAGELDWSEFLALAAPLHVASQSDVTVDLDRHQRCGYPEVIYGSGKPPETIAEIARQLSHAGQPVLATRIAAEKAQWLATEIPDGQYHALARCWRWDAGCAPVRAGRVAVLSAGTSDAPVAAEAEQTLDWMGVETTFIADIGVAGPHRLPSRLGEFRDCDAIVVVAGMEGALPSVVGGYVACPVIGVPTSVGYGAAFGGVAATLSMLNSCAANVTVVNIDAGFKAGFVAGLIARRAAGIKV